MLELIKKDPAFVIAWCSIIGLVFCLPFVWTQWSNWRYQRKFRRHVRVSAMMLARLAVFDSWVRSGGRKEPLCEDVELQLRMDYVNSARRNGPEYMKDYVMHEERADADLMALIVQYGLPKGTEHVDPFKTDLCTACDGTGKGVLPHYTSAQHQPSDVTFPCPHCHGTGKS